MAWGSGDRSALVPTGRMEFPGGSRLMVWMVDQELVLGADESDA